MTTTVTKKPAKRAFDGLAGSPLARIRKLFVEKSDYTLRVPKSPDREDPIPFNVWFDVFGQKHGRIDLDCSFQECAFDPHLGHGANPLDNGELPSHAGALRNDEFSSALQDLGLKPDQDSPEKASYATGLLEGDRQIKRRRIGERTWWVFDEKFFREFIESKYDPNDAYQAAKAYVVLHDYYHLNRQDEEIWDDTGWFENVKKVKQYRQFLVRQGADLFKQHKPGSTWHGRRAIRRGLRCADPNCDQCQSNEISLDFSGRTS
jgi:hypothetical protein